MRRKSNIIWPMIAVVAFVAMTINATVSLVVIGRKDEALGQYAAAIQSIQGQLNAVTGERSFIVQSTREVRVLGGEDYRLQVTSFSEHGAQITLGKIRFFLENGDATEFVNNGELCFLHLEDVAPEYAWFREGCTAL